MVYKIGGYVFTVEFAHLWMKKMGVDYDLLDDTGMSGELNRWFARREMTGVWAFPTCYPPKSRKLVIVIARKFREDPYSTPFRYSVYEEEPGDYEWKKRMMEESGLTDEQIPWATIADPFFEQSYG
ncbi:hypothetical protein DEU56DRAFT_462638 [Suillus clintonianus]|uniref:uncharacterized protein n=1 Tax=Suillus clintonianus TaxID=1904413 RepID=UPI001B864841|nr:uncharacterized protein DEU56DRAFT_462638 [Suillus clintonianus]KAG2130884.1 hypothetical protein DEU56DRAFT_462638 [Suillus clintonianus]